MQIELKETTVVSEVGAKLIAFYLPQYHPIPENDEWWGKGFTEWTNVTRAQPRFPGHYQPHLPADLGFYDLRLPEARAAQAELAQAYGIYGFCYYHYWFNGRRLLERPFDEVLRTGEPEFPFCLCWANENWTRRWDGYNTHILLEQHYNPADDVDHIRSLIPAFQDKRYIRIDGKPLFLVYRSNKLPNSVATTDRWREEAHRLGLGDLFLCRVETQGESGDPRDYGFDASVEFHPRYDKAARLHNVWWYRMQRLGFNRRYYPNSVYQYDDYVKKVMSDPPIDYPRMPCVFPSWDNSARVRNAVILANASPESYGKWLSFVINNSTSASMGSPIVFINAWNEWAEGAHLEPCQKWGHSYLEATREALIAGGWQQEKCAVRLSS